MLSVALLEPQIPPNTGNIIRLCANTGFALHLIGPMGFTMQEKQLRRAGLDYHEYAAVQYWDSWNEFEQQVAGRRISFSTKNANRYNDFSYQHGDILLFGSETTGLPVSVNEQIDPACRLTIPMKHNSRSLNLSNSVAVAVYEAWRQQDFV